MKTLTKENAQKLVELLHLNKEKEIARKNEILADLEQLRKDAADTTAILVGHNSILCYFRKRETMEDELVFVVDPDTDRRLVNLYQVDKFLTVPRYTPKTAKEWMATPLGLQMPGGSKIDNDYSDYYKAILSERQLREYVIQDRENTLSFIEENLKALEIAES